jgi:hypothetical protein
LNGISLQEFFAGKVIEVAIEADPNLANLMVLLDANAACGVNNIAIATRTATNFFIPLTPTQLNNSCALAPYSYAY